MIRRTAALTLAAGLCLGIGNASADTIRIAHIDPLSGPFALVGESTGRLLQAAVDDVNAKGGVLGGTKLELAHFDNKGSPQETMLLLKQIRLKLAVVGVGVVVANVEVVAVATIVVRAKKRKMMARSKSSCTSTAFRSQ